MRTQERMTDEQLEQLRHEIDAIEIKPVYTQEELIRIIETASITTQGLIAEVVASREKANELEMELATTKQTLEKLALSLSIPVKDLAERGVERVMGMKARVNKFESVTPQTIGDFYQQYGFYPPCEGHEWDNRTSPENVEWAFRLLQGVKMEDKVLIEENGALPFRAQDHTLGCTPDNCICITGDGDGWG